MKAEEVAIITPYESQNRCITNVRNRYPELKNVSARDIDGFQGQERDFIVVSFVRCNSKGSVGFVDDANRVNVILTRARRGLVVLGCESTLRYCLTSGLSRLFRFARSMGVSYVYR